MSDLLIAREDGETKGRYTLEHQGHHAELTYSILSPRTRIADHTDVPDALRGQKIGEALVERLVADARREGWQFVPLCPFVNAQRRKHPEWADAFNV